MYFTIKWCNGDAKGYTDYLPEEWFRREGETKSRNHEILGPQGGISEAKCDLNVKGFEVVLDYTKYAESNNKIIIGTMKLLFENNQRKKIEEVLWKDEGGSKFVSCPLGSEVLLGKSEGKGIYGKKRKNNPSWTRDELILTLELYLLNRDALPDKDSDEIRDLSELLNKLGKALGIIESEKFRNLNGVHMKLMNFRAIDPLYKGKGLQRGGKLEKEVWDEFSNDLEKLKIISNAIRVNVDQEATTSDMNLYDEEEAEEGRYLTKVHKSRERSRELVQKKKAQFKEKYGRVFCEACGHDFEKVYGSRGEGFIECHHTKPVSELRPGSKTKLSELVLVCSNCHRIIHRMRPWLTLDELKGLMQV